MFWTTQKRRIVTALTSIFFSMTVGAQLAESAGLFDRKYISTIAKETGSQEHNSANGRPIILFKVNNPDNKKPVKHRMLIQGGMHGNEKLTASFVVWLANRFAKGESLLNKIPEPISIDFISILNPDGFQRNYRYNSNAVNLNRNFSVLWGLTKENPGKKAFSEPETKALRALFKKRKYTSSIDVHGYINWIVAPSSAKQVGRNNLVDMRRFSSWIKAIKESMNLLPKYELKTAGQLGDGGAFEDWAFWEMNSFAVCLEMANATRFAEIHSNTFQKGTDTFLKYEAFIDNIFRKSIQLKKSESVQLTLSR